MKPSIYMTDCLHDNDDDVDDNNNNNNNNNNNIYLTAVGL